PALSPALLHRLDSDAASSANAQRGLLGMIEEVIRAHIAGILEQVGHGGGGGLICLIRVLTQPDDGRAASRSRRRDGRRPLRILRAMGMFAAFEFGQAW